MRCPLPLCAASLQALKLVVAPLLISGKKGPLASGEGAEGAVETADAASKVHKVCQVQGPLVSEWLGFEELVPRLTARTGLRRASDDRAYCSESSGALLMTSRFVVSVRRQVEMLLGVPSLDVSASQSWFLGLIPCFWRLFLCYLLEDWQ